MKPQVRPANCLSCSFVTSLHSSVKREMRFCLEARNRKTKEVLSDILRLPWHRSMALRAFSGRHLAGWGGLFENCRMSIVSVRLDEYDELMNA